MFVTTGIYQLEVAYQLHPGAMPASKVNLVPMGEGGWEGGMEAELGISGWGREE